MNIEPLWVCSRYSITYVRSGHSTFIGERGESSRHDISYFKCDIHKMSKMSVTACPLTVQRPQQQIKDRYKEGPVRRVYGKWSWLIMSWTFSGTFSQISCVKMEMEREQECPVTAGLNLCPYGLNKPVIHSHTLWKTSIHSLRIAVEYINWGFPVGIQPLSQVHIKHSKNLN